MIRVLRKKLVSCLQETVHQSLQETVLNAITQDRDQGSNRDPCTELLGSYCKCDSVKSCREEFQKYPMSLFSNARFFFCLCISFFEVVIKMTLTSNVHILSA